MKEHEGKGCGGSYFTWGGQGFFEEVTWVRDQNEARRFLAMVQHLMSTGLTVKPNGGQSHTHTHKHTHTQRKREREGEQNLSEDTKEQKNNHDARKKGKFNLQEGPED